jgi:hypothetical protein
MPKESEKPVTHTFRGIEIKTQVWYNACMNDVPKLTIMVGGEFYFNNTFQVAPGKFVFGDWEPTPGSCSDTSFPAMLTAFDLAKQFLSEVQLDES